MDALKQKILDARESVTKLEAQLAQKNEELKAIIKEREAVFSFSSVCNQFRPKQNLGLPTKTEMP